jgi:hypothetical protein
MASLSWSGGEALPAHLDSVAVEQADDAAFAEDLRPLERCFERFMESSSVHFFGETVAPVRCTDRALAQRSCSPSLANASIMTIDINSEGKMIQVTAIRLSGGNLHEHISELQWRNTSTSSSGSSTRSQLVAWLEQDGNQAIVSAQGRSVYV